MLRAERAEDDSSTCEEERGGGKMGEQGKRGEGQELCLDTVTVYL